MLLFSKLFFKKLVYALHNFYIHDSLYLCIPDADTEIKKKMKIQKKDKQVGVSHVFLSDTVWEFPLSRSLCFSHTVSHTFIIIAKLAYVLVLAL